MRLWLVWGEPDHGHEVGWMTGCWKGTSALAGLVDWAVVVRIVFDLLVSAGFEPYHRTLNKEYLSIRFIQQACLVIPLAPFNEHTAHVNTILWWGWVLILDYFKVESQLINGDQVLTSVVLHGTCQETLSEVELIDPVERWNTVIDPILEEFQSLFEILDIATQGFEWGIRSSFPQLRYLTIKERLESFFKLSREQNFTLDGFFEILQRVSDNVDQTVETD